MWFATSDIKGWMSERTGSSDNVIRCHSKCDFTRVQLGELMSSLNFLTEHRWVVANHMGKCTHRVHDGLPTVAEMRPFSYLPTLAYIYKFVPNSTCAKLGWNCHKEREGPLRLGWLPGPSSLPHPWWSINNQQPDRKGLLQTGTAAPGEMLAGFLMGSHSTTESISMIFPADFWNVWILLVQGPQHGVLEFWCLLSIPFLLILSVVKKICIG